MTTREAFLVGGVRTPVGRCGGALSGVRPDDLAALVVSEAIRRAGVDPERVDEVILGDTNQAGEDNRNVARMAVLLAGLPLQIPGHTVNRLCASGLTAVANAAMGPDRCRHDRLVSNQGGQVDTVHGASVVASCSRPAPYVVVRRSPHTPCDLRFALRRTSVDEP